MLDVLAALTDECLYEEFGVDAVQRGRPYATGQALSGVEITDSGASSLSSRAMVRGSQRHPYYVELHLELYDDEVDAYSVCSCPVGDQCKHGAALAMALRGSISQVGAEAWDQVLSGLIDETDRTTESSHGVKRLALQLSLTMPRTSHTAYGIREPILQLRPLQEGARQNWIKTGIKWTDVPTALTRGEHDPEQLDILAQLYACLATARTYWSLSELPQLHQFGPALWRRLREAHEAGIAFQPAGPLAGVELVDHDLELSADLTSGRSGTEVRLGIEHDDTWWSGENVLNIGLPAHGVALVREVPGATPKAALRHHVTLASLDRPARASTVRRLRGTDGILVPKRAHPAFEREFLPSLQQRFPLRSSDGSVTIPEPLAPALTLRVTWRTATHADLQWRWRYGNSTDDAPQCPVDSSQRLNGLRDHAAERLLLERLTSEVELEEPSLRDHAVTGEDALRLAEETLPRLHASGLVEVNEERRPDFREAEGDLEVRFEAASPTTSDPDAPTDWLDLQIQMTVDGEQVPLVEVLGALTTGQSRIILPSGLHLASDRPEFRALHDLVVAAAELRDADGTGDGASDRVSVGTHDLGLWAQLADLGVVDDQASTWVRRAQALRDLTEIPTPDPTGVVSTMRGYQLDGFRWLAFLWEHQLGGILADDMGLGKTLQVLALISHARVRGSEPFLVVAPTSVVSAWQSEAARHTPDLRVRAVTASTARLGLSLETIWEDADVVVTTYTLLRLGLAEYADLSWGGLVLDEAQQVKNHRGKTYQAVRQLEAPFKLAVTGTPFENRLMELWSLLSITTPGLYPWPAKFTEHVVRPVEKQGDAAALRRFRQRIRPFLLRRTKELVAADLPPKQEQILEVQLGAKHRRVYDTHLQRERQKVLGLVGEFERNRVAIFSSLTRLRQLALDAGLVDPEHADLGSAKLDALVEHLTEIIAEGHRALVFSQFTTFLGQVRARLDAEGITTSYLDGTTRKRGDVVDQFKSGDHPVFLISLKAGGVGLTLTEADYVFVLDPWWNPATEAQAVDRTHRIGQTRPVMVYRLVAADTIEQKVMELKARKAELFAQVIDGDGALSTAISADDIRHLFGE